MSACVRIVREPCQVQAAGPTPASSDSRLEPPRLHFQTASDEAQAAVQAAPWEHCSRGSPRVSSVTCVFTQRAELISRDIFVTQDAHRERPLEPRALWVGAATSRLQLSPSEVWAALPSQGRSAVASRVSLASCTLQPGLLSRS